MQIKYFTFHPNVFPNMIGSASPGVKCGDVVTVYDREGQPFGHGFFNPSARVPLRLFQHGLDPLSADHFEGALRAAVSLRLETLRLQEQTDAIRLVHSDGDGIPGLMVDKFGDVLAIEISNAAALQRLGAWIPLLHELAGTKEAVVHCDINAIRAEVQSRLAQTAKAPVAVPPVGALAPNAAQGAAHNAAPVDAVKPAPAAVTGPVNAPAAFPSKVEE